MRSTLPLVAMLFIGGSGAARALLAIPQPTGHENPYPYILAFIILFASIFFAYVGTDWLTMRRVRSMKEGRDVEGLKKVLRSAWLASKAACALGDMRDPMAVEPLVEALESGDEDVRQAAAKALGDIGDDRAVAPLLNALDDRYAGVRECASYALRKIRSSS